MIQIDVAECAFLARVPETRPDLSQEGSAPSASVDVFDRIEVHEAGRGGGGEGGDSAIFRAHCYFAENRASGRVLEKLGFGEAGRSIPSCLVTGGDVPSVEMSLSAPTPSPADERAALTSVMVQQPRHSVA